MSNMFTVSYSFFVDLRPRRRDFALLNLLLRTESKVWIVDCENNVRAQRTWLSDAPFQGEPADLNDKG